MERYINKEMLVFQLDHAATALRFAAEYSRIVVDDNEENPLSGFTFDAVCGFQTALESFKNLVEHNNVAL